MFISDCYKRPLGSREELGHAKCFIFFLYASAKTALKVAVAETNL